MLSTDKSAEELIKRAVFLVEANDFESFCLWQQHSTDSIYQFKYFQRVKWEQINPAHIVRVGTLDKRPINLCIKWARINGLLVGFWYQCSQVTDGLKAEKWIKQHFKGTYDNGTRRAECDAMNFGHCLSAVKEINKRKETEV